MGTIITALIVIAIAAMVFGTLGPGVVRKASRGVALAGLLLFGLITVASLYGMVALGSRDGGVLLFVAIPAGIIAWLFYRAYTSSRETEEFLTLPADVQFTQTHASIEVEIARLEQLLERGRLSAEAVGRVRGRLAGLRVMRDALEREGYGATVGPIPPP